MCAFKGEEVVWSISVSGVQCALHLSPHTQTHSPQTTQEIINHITVRVPGPDAHFLINPFGLYYGEVRIRCFVVFARLGEGLKTKDGKANTGLRGKGEDAAFLFAAHAWAALI